MSKVFYNGTGYYPVVATDWFSGTVTSRTVWTPSTYRDAHINTICISMDGPGRIQLNSSAGDPITSKIYLPSGTTTISGGSHELYVAPSGTTIKATTNSNAAYSITIYGHER